MKPEDFEKQLQRQPFRQVPAAWRGEILAVAERKAGRPDARVGAPTFRKPWWSEWLWPSPVAWGAVACTWVVILTLQVASREPGAEVARNSQPPSPTLMNALAEQRRLMTELTGPLPTPADAVKPGEPGPSSKWRAEIATA